MNVATTLLVSASLAKCFRSVLKSSSSGVPKLSTDLGFCALGPDLVVGVAASLLRIKFSFAPSVNWYADKNVPSKTSGSIYRNNDQTIYFYYLAKFCL